MVWFIVMILIIKSDVTCLLHIIDKVNNNYYALQMVPFTRESKACRGQNLKFCTVVDFGGRVCNVILKSLLTLYFQFHIEK